MWKLQKYPLTSVAFRKYSPFQFYYMGALQMVGRKRICGSKVEVEVDVNILQVEQFAIRHVNILFMADPLNL